MKTCDSAIPIRSPERMLHQESIATCMRCGEEYKSRSRDTSLSEQSCGCGMVYRVEALPVDVIADIVVFRDDSASANEASFWGDCIQ